MIDYTAKKRFYTNGGVFNTLTGGDYVGYVSVLSGVAYEEASQYPLLPTSTFECNYLLSRYLKDRTIDETITLPFNSADILLGANDFLTHSLFLDKLRKLYDNNTYVYTRMFMPNNDLPAKLSVGSNLNDYSYACIPTPRSTSLSSVSRPVESAPFSTSSINSIRELGNIRRFAARLKDETPTDYTVFAITNNGFTTLSGNRNNCQVIESLSTYIESQENQLTFGSLYDITLSKNCVFITDERNSVVYKIDVSGYFNGDLALANKRNLIEILGGDGPKGAKNLFKAPKHITSSDNIIVINDSGNKVLKVFDTNFNFITYIPSIPNVKESIEAIQINPFYNTLYVFTRDADKKNVNLYIIELKFFRVVEVYKAISLSLQPTETINNVEFTKTNNEYFYICTDRAVYKLFVNKPNTLIGQYQSLKLDYILGTIPVTREDLVINTTPPQPRVLSEAGVSPVIVQPPAPVNPPPPPPPPQPPQPFVSIDTICVARPDNALSASKFTYTVTRTGDMTQELQIPYVVTGSGDNPAQPSDFIGSAYPNGQVTIKAGYNSNTFTVSANPDLVVETDETFSVTLQPGSNYKLGTDTVGCGIILNDDEKASVSINAECVDNTEESDDGEAPLLFSITRKNDPSTVLNIPYVVTGSGDIPAQPSDFVGGKYPSGVIQMTSGQVLGRLIITVKDATAFTLDKKKFTVTLSALSGSNYTLENAVGCGVIINHGPKPPDNPVIPGGPGLSGNPQQPPQTFVPVSIVQQPVGGTIRSGETVLLSVSAIGTAPIYYQWFKGNVPVSTFDTINREFRTPPLTAQSVYTVQVTNKDFEELPITRVSEQAVINVITPPDPPEPPKPPLPPLTSWIQPSNQWNIVETKFGESNWKWGGQRPQTYIITPQFYPPNPSPLGQAPTLGSAPRFAPEPVNQTPQQQQLQLSLEPVNQTLQQQQLQLSLETPIPVLDVPAPEISLFTVEPTVNVVTVGYTNILFNDVYKGISFLPTVSGFDSVVFITSGRIYFYNEIDTFKSVIKTDKLEAFGRTNLTPNSEEYIQASTLNKELYKVVRDILTLKNNIVGRFTGHYDNSNIFTLDDYNYDIDLSAFQLNAIQDFYIHENEKSIVGVINRVLTKILELQRSLIDLTAVTRNNTFKRELFLTQNNSALEID